MRKHSTIKLKTRDLLKTSLLFASPLHRCPSRSFCELLTNCRTKRSPPAQAKRRVISSPRLESKSTLYTTCPPSACCSFRGLWKKEIIEVKIRQASKQNVPNLRINKRRLSTNKKKGTLSFLSLHFTKNGLILSSRLLNLNSFAAMN